MDKLTLTKKDLIAINQKFAEGCFENESSLDYALSLFKQNIPWTKQLAYLIRAILIDHVFHEGNKRTAYAALLTYSDINGYHIEEKQAANLIKNFVLKNENNIAVIQRRIEDDIIKK